MEVRYAVRPDPRVCASLDLPGPGLIVLTGFMGTGKTRTGRALAEIVGTDFTDTDDLIAARVGLTIPEIFAQRGEPEFRRLEREVCRELGQRRSLVVATGGGTLLDEASFALLSSAGTVILLEASADAILARVGEGSDRPLLAGATSVAGRRARVAELLAARAMAYSRASLRIDTTDLDPSAAARRVAALLDLPSHEIAMRFAGSAPEAEVPSRIAIGRGLLSSLGARIAALELGPRVFVCMAAGLHDLYLDQVASSLDKAGLSWESLAIRDGDAHKTLGQVEGLVDRLAALGADRHAALITVGGGVTGDLAGFAASIYMRGLPLVHVPTTLLAQVDASIGGKVAVNHPRAKNLIGSFHQPRLVLSDPCVLRTLPDRELANGMAEVIKTALLGSPDLFALLEEHLTRSPARSLRDPVLLERCVTECAAVKAAVVARDPHEAGERRVLNLGHTAGHALEAAGGYGSLNHGEAVAIGLVIAARLACDRGLIPRGLVTRTRRLLARCGLPVFAPPVAREAFTLSLGLDKKKRNGRLRYVLPAGPGECLVTDEVSADEVWGALTAERDGHGG